MNTQVKFHCQNCGCPIVADGDAAGSSFQCFRCPEMVTIPSPTTVARIDESLPLVASSTNADGTVVASPQNAHDPSNGTTPVEIMMPGQMDGMKVNVDQKTSNVIATTFLGGTLVVVGAVLGSILGGKSRA